jgi:ABC-type transport system substrate-binding protein
MKQKNFSACFSIVFALVIILTACGQATPTQQATAPTQQAAAPTQPAAPPTQKAAAPTQQVVEPTQQAPTPTQQAADLELVAIVSDLLSENFDPILIRGGDNIDQTLPPMFETLVTIRDGKYVGVLAESWEQAPDQLSWTFHLRKGVKFQNGDDFTAEDVKFSFERYISDECLRQANAKLVFTTVDILDDYTVRINTDGYKPYFMTSLYADQPHLFFIMPKNYIEKNGADYFNQHPIGTGPYKFVQLVSGDRIEYEAWDGYWGSPPAFNKYTMKAVPEETTAVALLQTGDADIVNVGFDNALSLKDQGYNIQSFGPADVNIQFFGTQMPEMVGKPLADPNVRLALRLAVDEESIINDFFAGEVNPPVLRGVTPATLGVDYQYWVDYTANKYHYDPVLAKQLLKDAGYETGLSVTLVETASPEVAAWLLPLQQIVAQYWTQIGVDVQIESMDWGAFQNIWNVQTAPDMIGKIWVGDNSQKANAPAALTTQFSSLSPTYNLLWNGTAGSPPEVQDLLTQSYSSVDPTLLNDLLLAVDSTQVMLPICVAKSYMAIGPRLSVEVQYPENSASTILPYIVANP